jgi:hypothetical protein
MTERYPSPRQNGPDGARPASPCTGDDSFHLARFQSAERRSLISRDELVRVVSRLAVIAARALAASAVRMVSSCSMGVGC